MLDLYALQQTDTFYSSFDPDSKCIQIQMLHMYVYVYDIYD